MLSLLDKVHGKGKRFLTEDDIVRIHDRLMVEYGWIPFEEFKSLPFVTMIGLLKAIDERHEKEQKEMNRQNGRL